jgi:hypothetical protein
MNSLKKNVLLTSVILMVAYTFILSILAQLVQTEIGHLQHPPAGDDAIAGLEVAVAPKQ